ncbi:dsRBD fold-containing protein [Streptomyces sp. NPDC052051]|uniref:dsRBD fold-containing protein n=1 Tax=Streptomyces sp. NPDC052051 TaxID=3154649 RepID=UPI00341B75C1
MTGAAADGPVSAKEWTLRLYLSEHDPDTAARVVLNTGDTVLESHAEAHRNPDDSSVPEIGEELAVGRALVALGHQLIRAAAGDIKAVGALEEPSPAPLWSARE